MHTSFRVVCLFFALVTPIAAQRPKTASDALARFAQVKDTAEAERRRATGDLADFADPEVTAVLLAELARAEGLAYRQVVVRALGASHRAGAVPALLQALREATNNRLMDSAAEGLARQGEPGVKALGDLLAADRTGSARRTAVCEGLARAEGELARDLLLGELKIAGGRDRLPVLRGLSRRSGDALVDAARIQLAGDRDALVAATALRQLAEHGHAEAPKIAAQLLHRLGPDSSAEHYTAVLRGLLLEPTTSNPEAILLAAARAEDPFSSHNSPAWQRALQVTEFVQWFADQAPLRKSPAERALAAQALGLATGKLAAVASPGLVRLLAQREFEVVRAAAFALVGCGAEAAFPALQKLLETGAEPLQPIALSALHELKHGEPAWSAELLRHASARAASLRAAALNLLARMPRLDQGSAVAAATDNLGHKSWPVRSAAIDLLVAARAEAGIPLLIERLDAEQARLQQDVQDALFALTRLRLADAPAWRAFWQREGATFRVPTAKPASSGKEREASRGGTVVTYWDIPVRSDRVAFVVDVSGSMNQPFGTGGGTRLDEAKRQLIRVLGMLPPKAKANIITFGNDTDAFAENLQPIDDKRRKAAEQWTHALAVHGATNVHAGLLRAFADPAVDTIFLLTDGQPSAGEIVERGPLAKAVASWNIGRALRIHTVAIGGKSDFLEQLARESGGEHTVAK